ncbi:MAG: hypothetical protein ACRD04_12190 [Terriglobales bacterium]
MYEIIKTSGAAQMQRLGDPVAFTTLQWFKRNYDIPVHHFFNPGMALGAEPKDAQEKAN